MLPTRDAADPNEVLTHYAECSGCETKVFVAHPLFGNEYCAPCYIAHLEDLVHEGRFYADHMDTCPAPKGGADATICICGYAGFELRARGVR